MLTFFLREFVLIARFTLWMDKALSSRCARKELALMPALKEALRWTAGEQAQKRKLKIGTVISR